MAETTAKTPCARCGMPMSADWQWCQACGYDPDRRRPDPTVLAAKPARPPRPRRRLGGLSVVLVTALVAVGVVLWVVVRNGPDTVLAPTVDTTPQLGPSELAVRFNAAVATTTDAEETFHQAQAAASAACGCPSGETDPQGFARDAAALLPSQKAQEEQLVELSRAASADVAEHLQAMIDVNRRIQADIVTLTEHSGDTDTSRLLAAQRSLLKDLAVRSNTIQTVQQDLNIPDEGQPRN